MGKCRHDLAQKLKSLALEVRRNRAEPGKLPSGLAKFCTSPVPTGSPTATITSGTVVVFSFTASAAGVPAVTITSTLPSMNSATSAGNRSYLPSAQR